jgi:hypothetical protein
MQGVQPLGRVERRVAGVQHVARRVVDVEEHGVHALRAVGAESTGLAGEREEVALHQPGAWVAAE